ncbi:hypothetical protein SEA_POUND_135 [Mycobacterium phage Pound]|nr:hypothetical protein SEA_POUND_135 [Mycobacterium phage Pound]
MTIEEAKDLLKLNGYVVLKEKSYRQAQERQRAAEAYMRCEEEAAEHARAWARDCFAEQRRLADRCTFLYGAAIAAGATPEELRGGFQ